MKVFYSFRSLIFIFSFVFTSCYGNGNSMASPDGKVVAHVSATDKGLSYQLIFHNDTVISNSSLGVMVDDVLFGGNTIIDEVKTEIINDSYLTRGFHTSAVNHCIEKTYRIKTNERYFILETRTYNDGFAFRYLIPADSEKTVRTVKKELTSFGVPANLPVWFFERDSDWKLKTYAGMWTRSVSDSLHCISPNGPVQGPALVYELPGKRYMAITESALYNYSGMRLEAKADAALQVNFTENDGFQVSNEIVTPWRVIILADDLNELVNTDLITNLNPAPDPELFQDVEWIKPGRSVWSWWSQRDGYMTPAYEKRFIDMASELGYEYTTIDEGWEKQWPDKWAQLKEMCDYAREREVGIFVWKRSREISGSKDDYQAMRLFLDSVEAAGASGLKIDFMDSESKEYIDFDIKALQLCAERRLMVNFHGCQKPSGEFRTYPNEMTREGIRGLELNKMNQHITGNHNVALVFTRCILNNADYTPVGFSNPGNTTWTHQLATAYAFTSPLMTIAEHPDLLLNDKRFSPVLPLIKALPTVWDQTIVMPGSSIDETAILARRTGNEWYLVALNGDKPKSLAIPLKFLGQGKWNAFIVRDSPDPFRKMQVNEDRVSNEDSLEINMDSNGGYVARLSMITIK